MKIAHLLALAIVARAAAPNKSLPHIFFVIVDDFGWSEVGYHGVTPSSTPTMDALVKEGVELNRHYVHMMCTPSRASFQTGRLPTHILTQLASPCDKNGAIPRNMTGIAKQLKKAGYATHQVGKWDAGMTTPHHTPQGRGYDTSLNYFSHGNWMYSEAEWLGSYHGATSIPLPGLIDLWDTDKPASNLNGTGYEELLFRDRILKILHEHPQDGTPLFLQYDSKVAHYPMQAPVEYQQKFANIQEDHRRTYVAMVAFLDDQLKNITDTMKQLGMWDNTLMVLSSDNGGYVGEFDGACNTSHAGDLPDSDFGHGTACFNGEAGANNYPLRGGKYSNFEGGIRVNAFASGGYLPAAVRGSKLEGMIHIADWYSTLCGLAGVSPRDQWAEQSGLPAPDSLDVWPMLSGQNLSSPRTSILVTADMLIQGEWKYVKGNANMIEAARGGPQYPNASTASDPIKSHNFKCPQQGCLYNVVRDVTEDNEVSSANPAVVAEMQAELEQQAKHIWSTTHVNDPECRTFAQEHYSGFLGPWKEV